MADPRFFTRHGPFSLAHLAEIAGAELRGGPAAADREIADVAPLEAAGPDDIGFLDNRRYVSVFERSAAGACLVAAELADRAPEGMALLVTPKPYEGYARVAATFYPQSATEPGRHPTAVVAETARIGDGTWIGPGVVVGERVEIGRDCHIAANAVIADGVVVGDASRIGANAFLTHCIVGQRCHLHAGVCIGNRGFGFAMEAEGFTDVPQLGRVLIEDDVEVGANSTIDRGAGPDTVIGAGSKIDNLIQIGHNVRLGRGCVLVAQSGVAGSTKLEDHVLVAAQAGLAGHLTIGKGARIAAKSGVMRDIPPGQAVGGIPALPLKEFFRLCTLWQRQLKAKGRRDE